MSNWYRLFVLNNVVLSALAQNDYCREGTYGNNCELTCPKQCRPLQSFPCDKRTGRCSEGCNGGYYGDQCDKQCFCPSGICFQATGDCYAASTTSRMTTQPTTGVSSTTEATVHTPVCDGVSAGWRTAAVLFIVFIIILVCGGIMMFLNIRRRWMKQDKHSTVTMGAASAPLITKEGDAEAAGGQGETRKSIDDVSGIHSELNVPKQSSEIEELKEEIRELKREKDQAEVRSKKFEGTLKKYEYQEVEIQKLLGLSSNSTDSTISTCHLMNNNNLNKADWLHCPHVKFAKTQTDTSITHNDMMLSNRGDSGDRSPTFYVVACTPALINRGYHQYFEANFTINLDKEIGDGEIIMQLGFCEEKQVSQFKKGMNNGFGLRAVGCNKPSKICLETVQGDKIGRTEEQVMDNNVGSKTVFKLGIHLNRKPKKQKIRVYGLKNHKLLTTITNNMENVCPLFGLGANDKAAISVDLKTGIDIEMRKEKKDMIMSKV